MSNSHQSALFDAIHDRLKALESGADAKSTQAITELRDNLQTAFTNISSQFSAQGARIAALEDALAKQTTGKETNDAVHLTGDVNDRQDSPAASQNPQVL